MTPTRSINRRRRHATGFTLIELMIVVVIVAVLAAIAYGAYQSQVRKARRSDAIAMMSAVQQAQERWRANCPSYTASITNPAPLDAMSLCLPAQGLGFIKDTTDGGYYTLRVTLKAAPTGLGTTGYTLSATAAAGTSQFVDMASGSSCKVLTVDVDNGTATPTPSACWSK